MDYKNGKLTLTLDEIRDLIPADEIPDLIVQFACEDEIIRHVAAQIVDGWTDDGSHGSRGYSGKPSTPLDKARRLVAERAGDVARQEIETLKEALEREKARGDEAWRRYHEELNRRI